jgi:hypothetical protein
MLLHRRLLVTKMLEYVEQEQVGHAHGQDNYVSLAVKVTLKPISESKQMACLTIVIMQ